VVYSAALHFNEAFNSTLILLSAPSVLTVKSIRVISLAFCSDPPEGKACEPPREIPFGSGGELIPDAFF
jgi:hypothetical protein